MILSIIVFVTQAFEQTAIIIASFHIYANEYNVNVDMVKLILIFNFIYI